MSKNYDGNVLGRVIAVFLLVGAVVGARSIARGSFTCGMGGGGSCCMMEMSGSPAPAAAAPAAPAAPPASPK
jgi:hypothetical protein